MAEQLYLLNERDVAKLRETSRKASSLVRHREGRPPRARAAEPRDAPEDWVEVTSLTPTGALYPGSWYLDNGDGTFTVQTAVSVIMANGTTPTLGVLYLARMGSVAGDGTPIFTVDDGSPGGPGSSITVEELGGTPTYTGITTLITDDPSLTGITISQPSAGQVKITIAAAGIGQPGIITGSTQQILDGNKYVLDSSSMGVTNAGVTDYCLLGAWVAHDSNTYLGLNHNNSSALLFGVGRVLTDNCTYSTISGGTLYDGATGTAGGGDTVKNGIVTSLGTISGLTVPQGGSGKSSLTAYAVVCGGTTSTNPFQQVSGLGTTGQVLTSNGASALPTWQPNAAVGGSGTQYEVPVWASSTTLGNSTALDDGTSFAAGKRFVLGEGADLAGVTGTQNDYALPDQGLVSFHTGGGTVTFTGFVAPTSGNVDSHNRLVVIINSGGGNTLTLANQNAGSASANRIFTGSGSDLVLNSDSGAVLVYVHNGDAGWYVVGQFATSGSSLPDPVTAAHGGTGLATLTAHNVLLGEGTGNVAFAAPGTAGNLLLSQGSTSDPAFETMSGDATITSSGVVTVATVNGAAVIANTETTTTGTTTSTFATVWSISNSKGLHGSFALKNTGVTNGLTYRVTMTDLYGTASTAVVNNLSQGSKVGFCFDSQNFLGSTFSVPPPYQTALLEVEDQSAGSHTTYDVRRSVVG